MLTFRALRLFVVASAVACSGEAAQSTSSGAGGGGGGGQAVGLPPAPGPAKAGSGPGVVFAMSRIFLGDTDREGNSSPDAWEEFGFNLDGIVSKGPSSTVCKPFAPESTPASVFADGRNGIDNSLGRNALPLVQQFQAQVSEFVTAEIEKGAFTVMLHVEGLAAEADYNPLVTRLYGGADLGRAPDFASGKERWPLLPELLHDPGDPRSAKIQFPESYVVGDTWVSGAPRTVRLELLVGGNTATLEVRSALISMELSTDRATAIRGNIGGVVATEALIEEVRKIAGQRDPTFCDPEDPTFNIVADKIRGFSDVMQDGTQDPARTCDGLSVGIGFEMRRVELGDVAEPEPPQVHCEGSP